VLDAMSRVPRRTSALSLVRATAGDGAVSAINAETAQPGSEIQRGPQS
jgi:hypothetical protein